MSKFLLIVVVIFVAYWIVKSYKRRSQNPKAPGGNEDMVRCAQCGVHLPRSESVMTEQLFYCSAEHRQLHQHAD